jgi:flagellar hook protein FlgE
MGAWVDSGDQVMGLFDALTTAVSGMQAQSFAMQNISGNIANSQTTAYKAVDTSFEDLIPGDDDLPSQQVAGGVTSYSVSSNTVQGAITSASSPTDMAINGAGYFVVQSPTGYNGNAPIFGGVASYTRAGDFTQDANGYLVNGAGYYLEGIPLDPTTGAPTGNVAAPLQFQNNFLPAQATTQIDYAINLPTVPSTPSYNSATANSQLLNTANFTQNPTVAGTGQVIGTDATTFANESISGGSVTAYDANGTPVNIQLQWAQTSDTAGSATWNLFYQTNSSATGTQVAWQNVGTNFVFNASGQLNPPITNLALNGVTVNGASLGNLTLTSPTGSLTQFANTNGTATVNNLQQNGYAAGQLQSIAINSNGVIAGTFSNGKNVNLAEVPLVSFNSPDNLQSLTGGAYQATENSGPALAGATGTIVGQSLEGSNSDIATEFSKLIVTQEAYSANTKVITTADQMSQALLNILQ